MFVFYMTLLNIIRTQFLRT